MVQGSIIGKGGGGNFGGNITLKANPHDRLLNDSSRHHCLQPPAMENLN